MGAAVRENRCLVLDAVSARCALGASLGYRKRYRQGPMHTTVIRFGEDLWRLVQGEAARRGVSVAEWVRTAAAMRIGFEAATEGDELRADVLRAALVAEREAVAAKPSGRPAAQRPARQSQARDRNRD